MGLLDSRPVRVVFGLRPRAHDASDGPAVPAIAIIGALGMIGAFLLEFRLEPPLWVHAFLWPALVIPASVLTMWVSEALLAALRYRHQGE